MSNSNTNNNGECKNEVEIQLESDLERGSSSNRESVRSSKRSSRLVYCGDGVLEEFSDEDENECEDNVDALSKKSQPTSTNNTVVAQIDPKTLTWAPWLKHYASTTANKTLEACDFMGEKLAWWFGITKPKYLYEIEEYYRIKQEEEEEAEETVYSSNAIANGGDLSIQMKDFQKANNKNSQDDNKV